jgi:uncharacterized RDD family membrane protein YckC
MKCPKCHYLGFETGDRCRNCGYDFSLLGSAAESHTIVSSPLPSAVTTFERDAAVDDAWRVPSSDGAAVDRLAAMPLHPTGVDHVVARATVSRAVAPAGEDDLPLFTARSLDDEPLVRFPAPPRPPLAVRRTPDIPRIRPSAARRREETREDSFPELAPAPSAAVTAAPSSRPALSSRPAPSAAVVPLEPSSSKARAGAALLDLVLLAAVDLLVIYFTLRMAALTMSEWRLLPPVPLLLFLLMLKATYYFAFTAIGGQTIGKMAMHIRVVSDEGPIVAPALAFRRTLAAATSILTLGATFIPALVSRERRAVHDRVARTRVVALPGA